MHLWSGFNFAGRLTHMLRFTTLWTLLFLFEIFSLFLTSGYYAKEQLILSMVKVHVCYLNYHFCIAVHYPHSTFFVYFCCLQFKDLSFCCIIPWRLCTLHMQVDNGITSPSAKDAVLLRETGSAVILFAGAVDSWHFVVQGNGHLGPHKYLWLTACWVLYIYRCVVLAGGQDSICVMWSEWYCRCCTFTLVPM